MRIALELEFGANELAPQQQPRGNSHDAEGNKLLPIHKTKILGFISTATGNVLPRSIPAKRPRSPSRIQPSCYPVRKAIGGRVQTSTLNIDLANLDFFVKIEEGVSNQLLMFRWAIPIHDAYTASPSSKSI